MTGVALLFSCLVTAQQKDGDYIKDIEQENAKPLSVAGETNLGWSFYYPDDIKAEDVKPAVNPTPSPTPTAQSPKPMSVEWFAKNYQVKDFMEDGDVAVNPENELN